MTSCLRRWPDLLQLLFLILILRWRLICLLGTLWHLVIDETDSPDPIIVEVHHPLV